jgi:hypothetical protein
VVDVGHGDDDPVGLDVGKHRLELAVAAPGAELLRRRE